MPAAQQLVNAYRADIQPEPAYAPRRSDRKAANPCARSLQVVIHQSFDEIARSWAKLESQPNISLHQSLAWCRTWSDHHKHPVVIVEGRISGACSFILPLEIVSTRLGKVARFIGAPFSNVNTALFSSTFEHEADAALLHEVRNRLRTKLAGQVDLLVMSNIPPVWRGIRNPLMYLPSVANQNTSFQLPLLATWEETLAQINAKRRRKKYRTSVKRLDAIGGYEHVVAESDEDKERLMDLYFQQKAIRFKALGLPDAFKCKETKAFFHGLTKQPSQGDFTPLQIHALKLKACGSIAAIAGLSRKEDHVICQFSSIDETIAADSSPGEFLFYLMIEAMQNAGAAVFDFGIGDQLYKRSWCPVETEQRDVIVPLSMRGNLAAIATRSVVRTKAMIKQNPFVYQMVQKLRAGGPVAGPACQDDDA